MAASRRAPPHQPRAAVGHRLSQPASRSVDGSGGRAAVSVRLGLRWPLSWIDKRLTARRVRERDVESLVPPRHRTPPALSVYPVMSADRCSDQIACSATPSMPKACESRDMLASRRRIESD
jgi:hypothetical protein